VTGIVAAIVAAIVAVIVAAIVVSIPQSINIIQLNKNTTIYSAAELSELGITVSFFYHKIRK
jgi:hypothetical protein